MGRGLQQKSIHAFNCSHVLFRSFVCLCLVYEQNAQGLGIGFTRVTTLRCIECAALSKRHEQVIFQVDPTEAKIGGLPG